MISDGGDNHSLFREAELIARAIEADTQIYSISIVENLRSREEQDGADLWNRSPRSPEVSRSPFTTEGNCRKSPQSLDGR